jgi:hypothetical protein
MSWASLLRAWSAWIKNNAQGTIAIILRDAKPLIALPSTNNWKRLYLNRLICGVPDELSGDDSVKQHPLLKQYLSQCDCADYFTFADSGCYGTVVLELHKIGMRFQPLFFFSKNPHIRGFLNEIGISMKEGELLNDSLECCFPHIYSRPSKLAENNGRVEAVLHYSDQLSINFGKAAMSGVKNAAIGTSIDALGAAQELLLLSQKARQNIFTGILGHTSPEWSKKQEFLSSWPNHLHWV